MTIDRKTGGIDDDSRQIKLTFTDPTWPILRQTPGRRGRWGDDEFIINGPADRPYDAWVVFGDLHAKESAICPPNRTVLFTAEPPSVKQYDPQFLNQFAAVVTCHRDFGHPQSIYTQQALPWFVGRSYFRAENRWDDVSTKDYDELVAQDAPPVKTKLLSIVTSTKAFTPGHALRCEFVELLRREFGSDIDIFGVGHRDVPDKWDAIAPYQYHITIENSAIEHYWTEKLSDAFLAQAYPIYAGCPNIADYFTPDCMTTIDLSDFDAALATIRRVIADDVAAGAKDAVASAKRQVLDQYQLFPAAAQILGRIAGRGPAASPARVSLRPSAAFAPLIDRVRDTAKSVARRGLRAANLK